MAKIKIERVDELTPSSSTLCCKIHPQVKCDHCGLALCKDCGKKWSNRKHFILDMCRTKFTPAQLREAAICFKKRIAKDGTLPRRLGNCYVCVYKINSGDADREWVNEDERHL